MKIYLLDTNVVSHIVRGDVPTIRDRAAILPKRALFISVISAAELRFGLLKMGNPDRLVTMIEQFFRLSPYCPGIATRRLHTHS